jgi:hypothetical protein
VRKHILAAFLAVTVFTLAAGATTTALALPAFGECSSCHTANAAVSVTASAGPLGATSTEYTIDVANSLGAVGWAVFKGSTKIASAAGTTTAITLDNATTYTVYGAGIDGSSNKIGNSIQLTTVGTAAPVLCKYTYKFKTKKKVYKKLKAVLTNSVSGKKYTVAVSKKGVATWKSVPAGSYRLNTAGNKKFKFKARTVSVR